MLNEIKPDLFPCCLKEVDAAPTGEFTYMAVQGGVWSTVLQQMQAQQGESLTDRLSTLYSNLKRTCAPSTLIQEAIALKT